MKNLSTATPKELRKTLAAINKELNSGNVARGSKEWQMYNQQLVRVKAELAKIIGVSRQTINMIEKGDYNPTIGLCRKICKVLGCTLNDLFWEEN